MPSVLFDHVIGGVLPWRRVVYRRGSHGSVRQGDGHLHAGRINRGTRRILGHVDQPDRVADVAYQPSWVGRRRTARRSPGAAVARSTSLPSMTLRSSGRNSFSRPFTIGSSARTTVLLRWMTWRRDPSRMTALSTAIRYSAIRLFLSGWCAGPGRPPARPGPATVRHSPSSVRARNALWLRISELLRHTATTAR